MSYQIDQTDIFCTARSKSFFAMAGIHKLSQNLAALDKCMIDGEGELCEPHTRKPDKNNSNCGTCWLFVGWGSP